MAKKKSQGGRFPLAKMAGSSTLQNNPKEKATWSPEYRKIFIDLMVQQTLVGNKPTTSFNKVGWKHIRGEFNKKTNKNYDHLKFKNYMAQLKKEWNVWNNLISNTTGLGWDPVIQTVIASEEQWADYLKSNSKAAQFRRKPLENADELNIIFGGTSTLGNLRITPANQVLLNEDCVAESQSQTHELFGNTKTPLEEIIPNGNNNEGDTIGEGEETPSRRRSRSETATSRRKKRKDSRTSELSHCMATLIELAQEMAKAQLQRDAEMEKARLEREKDREEREAERENAREERKAEREKAREEREAKREKAQSTLVTALDRLHEMDDIPADSDLYIDVVELLEDPSAREMFILLGPTSRRKWVDRKLARLYPNRYGASL
ncbi:uncharacterized protein LOC143846342 [Tasmannia lanceolata]|uniref:uncharacterized protein LOC143846342 n=1 Tax=Tasmannia lanceolata TaxID=3420 RepID=UPI0040627EFB